MDAPDNQSRNRILSVLFIGVLMGALDIAIVGPALPAIRAHFWVDDRALAWIFTSYVLFNLVGTPLMAKLADAFGRRTIYVVNVSLFAVGSLVVAISPTFAVLLAGRSVQGLGAGGIFPVASAVIGDTFPPERRGRALGMIGAVFGVAFIIGPILGGVLLIFGWPWLFIINLPIAVVVVFMSLRTLPTTQPQNRQTFDWRGMAALGLLLASLTYGVNQIDTTYVVASILSPSVWLFVAVAGALVAVFWQIEERAEDPILHLSLFRTRQVVLVTALALGAGLGEAAVVFVPSLLVAAFAVTSSTASFMLLPVVLAMAVGAPAAGRLLDRFGSRVVVLWGTALLTVGMLTAGFSAHSLYLFYLAALLVGLGLSVLLGAPLRYIMLNEAPVSERSAAQGAISLFTSVGQLMGGAMVGAVADSRGGGVAGYQAAYLVVGAIALLLTLLASRLKSRAEELVSLQQSGVSVGVKSTQPTDV